MNQWFEAQSQRAAFLAQTAEARVVAVPILGVFVRAARAYGADRCSMLAAALAYYGLLSIFPFMLFILAVASPFLNSDAAIRSVSASITGYLPSGAQMIRAALQEVIRLRGAVTLVAAVGFLWSASSVFDLLQVGINRAFKIEFSRPMWRQRLVSLGMVIGASVLFGLSFVGTTAIRLGIHNRLFERHDTTLEILTILTAVLFAFIVFAILYRYVPYGAATRWRDVWFGALVAAVLWEIAKLGFSWYLTNFALLNLVYGSVGAVIALMLWGYVTTMILLYGAEIAAERTRSANHA